MSAARRAQAVIRAKRRRGKDPQHADAMAKATDRTVLGRFDQTTFTYGGDHVEVLQTER